MTNLRDFKSPTVTTVRRLVLFVGLTAGCGQDESAAWSTDRIEAVTPDDGMRWDWSELSCDGSWGWQSFDHRDGDGQQAGQWTVFPPRDFAVQVLGPEQLQRCLDLFEEGATACSVAFDGFDLSLGATGRLSMTLRPSALRSAAADGTVNATRAVGDIVEWVEDDAGVRTELGVSVE